MAGIIINKNYVTTNMNNSNVANNWMVLVYGITQRGTSKPTLIQNYDTFTSYYGDALVGIPTHQYVRFLLNSGVPILFKRIVDSSKLVAATATVSNSSDTELFKITALDSYIGNTGNDISFIVNKNSVTKVCFIQIKYGKNIVETFSLGQDLQGDIGYLVYNFITEAVKSTTSISNFVNFSLISENVEDWLNTFPVDVLLTGGEEPENTKEMAIQQLSDINSSTYNDIKLIHAITYYPQLRFCTTGGIVSSDITTNEKIFETLGTFATKCKTTFRVLIDYSVEMTDINTVRAFARTIAAKGNISPSVFAYFGFYGADNNNTFLPGSAGFLTALARSGYNVYSRRIAGSGFSPAYTKPYKEIYVDALTDWQDEQNVQVNPIMIIDAQDNLAVMGSSTLAMPLSSLNAKDPSQALDVCCVGDYVAAILNGIALDELEVALDRLTLSSLANRMNIELERFVTSGAITRYNLDFDTTQLGKLGVNCTLYFAVGLEEVVINVTSTYDTDIIG